MPTKGKIVDVDRWEHAAVIEVSLASGAGVVRQRPGTLGAAIRHGRIPNPLLGFAIKAEYSGITPEAVAAFTAEEAASFEAFKCFLVSDSLVEPLRSPEQVEALPAIDREQLFWGALHVFQGDVLAQLASLTELAKFRSDAGGETSAGGGQGAGTTPQPGSAGDV